MDEIRSLLSLTDTGAQTCAEVMARTELHLEDVRRRIADLQKIEVTLATTLARCTAIARQRGAYRGRKRSLSDEMIADLHRRVAAGERKATIARDMGISRETLYQYLRAAA